MSSKYFITNNPERSLELKDSHKQSYDLQIPDNTEIRVSHLLKLQSSKATEEQPGLPASKVTVMNMRLPSGAEVTLESAPVDVHIIGKSTDNNLLYTNADRKTKNMEKDFANTKIKTVGYTEMNGLPSGLDGTFNENIDAYEDKYGVVEADDLVAKLSNFSAVFKYDDLQPDSLTVLSKDDEVLIQQTTMSHDRAVIDIRRNLVQMYEKNIDKPNKELEGQLFYSTLEKDGQIKSNLIHKDDFEYLPDDVKGKVIQQDNFNQLRDEIKRYNTYEATMTVKPINYSKTPSTLELMNSYVRDAEQLKAHDGVIAKENPLNRVSNYSDISKPYQDKVAILQISETGYSNGDMKQHFHQLSPDIHSFGIEDLNPQSSDFDSKLEEKIKKELDGLEADGKMVLIGLDDEMTEAYPDMQKKIEGVVYERDKFDPNVGFAPIGEGSKQVMDRRSPSERVSLLERITRRAVHDWKVKVDIDRRYAVEKDNALDKTEERAYTNNTGFRP